VSQYFAFTTLSTVGYGDFHAMNDFERLVVSFILLFGVALFSFTMGNFISILSSLQVVTAENENSEELTKWLSLLARFNKGKPLSKIMTRKIEGYFDYYWKKDKNYAVKSEEDERFLSELPKQIKINVMRSDEYNDFHRSTRTFCSMISSISLNRISRSPRLRKTLERHISHGRMITSIQHL
jgi:hypothetical protein